MYLEVTSLQKQKAELTAALLQANEAHRTAQAALRNAIDSIKRRLQLAAANLDENKIAAAERLLHIEGRFTGEGDQHNAVEEAMADIFAGGSAIRKKRFGTKNYASFYSQRCDCEYGMGPRHGSINFAVGLQRRFCDGQEAGGLAFTSEQIEAALYYLSRLADAQPAAGPRA